MSSVLSAGDGPPKVMGIVNVTPDSFSDGGRFLDHAAAIEHGRQLLAEGADFLDIGGESSRPGASKVPEQEELDRVIPVIEALASEARSSNALVSIDTMKPAVAHAAVGAGASIINDVSAVLIDVAAEHQVPLITMHMRGTPATMQDDPQYDDVVAEVHAALAATVAQAKAAGVPEIMVDPGVGFGKTAEHNMSLLAAVDRFADLGPVLLAVSRKSFIGAIHGRSDRTDGPADVTDRLEGSLAIAVAGAMHGVDVVRAHDVRATVQAMRVVGANSHPSVAL